MQYSGSKEGAQWIDLWNTATTCDYIIGQASAGGEAQLIAVLSTNDTLEVGLRRLASYVYFVRTRDRAGANHMLAVQPPGSSTDFAPTWLVDNVTTHSKSEFQRDQRVTTSSKKSKGEGKGKKGKKGKDADGVQGG